MSNSELISYTKLSPNNSGYRTHKIDRITPHCFVAQCSIQAMGNLFAEKSFKASANYGIDKEGKIGIFVPENCRSWCSSNEANDQRAVTIECASDIYPPYAMFDSVYKSLVDLCFDICTRNEKNRLLWIDDKEKALSYPLSDGDMLLTVHRWFASKECPGKWLYDRLPDLAKTVTEKLMFPKLFRVQIGAFKNYDNAKRCLTDAKNKGFFDAFIVE